MDKIRIVVIGCGLISKFHITAIKEIPEAELAGVYDVISAAADKTAADCGVRAYHHLEDIWADETVNAVCICTPSGTHGALAVSALEHNKHIMIEKPMALQREECDRIIALAKEKNLCAGVVSQLRFSPGIQSVKQAVEQGLLGKLLSVELNMKYYRDQAYYASSGWRGTWKMDGGGALMNQGIHGVDLLQYIAGMPKAVFGQWRTLRHDIEVEDTLHAMLMYENGAVGSLVATTSVFPGFSRELTLCGENGTIILEEDTVKYWHVQGQEVTQTQGTSDFRGTNDPANIGASGHVKQLYNFVKAIMGREKLLIDAQEGTRPLRIIWGIYDSGRNNSVVEL